MRGQVIIGSIVCVALSGALLAFAGIKYLDSQSADAGNEQPQTPELAAPESGTADAPESAEKNASPPTLLARAETSTVVAPKPLSDAAKKGLAYLVNQQHEDGGWGQGGGWRQADQGSGRVEGAHVQDPSDVGNTCIATLALLRAGHTPKEGEYSKNVARAVAFICKNVDSADKDSLYVTPVRNTQLQSKIGPYIDTFLTALVLAELKGKMADDQGEKTLLASLDKTIFKIEKNQKADGTWANEGWAAVISQGVCTKGLNRARQKGAKVSEAALAQAENWGKRNFDAKSGKFGASGAGIAGVDETATAGRFRTIAAPIAGPGDAGVPLYGAANTISSVQDSVNSNRLREKDVKKAAEDPQALPEKRDEAQKELKRFEEAEETLKVQREALGKQLENQQFVQGFGSNGGEEFLSFMSIGETLLFKGGKDWEKWDKQMTDGLTRSQDKDGSWSGHHCITGKTFCTSAALLVLMTDRMTIPTAAKAKE